MGERAKISGQAAAHERREALIEFSLRLSLRGLGVGEKRRQRFAPRCLLPLDRRRNGLDLECAQTHAGLANECVVDTKRSPRLQNRRGQPTELIKIRDTLSFSPYRRWVAPSPFRPLAHSLPAYRSSWLVSRNTN